MRPFQWARSATVAVGPVVLRVQVSSRPRPSCGPTVRVAPLNWLCWFCCPAGPVCPEVQPAPLVPLCYRPRRSCGSTGPVGPVVLPAPSVLWFNRSRLSRCATGPLAPSWWPRRANGQSGPVGPTDPVGPVVLPVTRVQPVAEPVVVSRARGQTGPVGAVVQPVQSGPTGVVVPVVQPVRLGPSSYRSHGGPWSIRSRWSRCSTGPVGSNRCGWVRRVTSPLSYRSRRARGGLCSAFVFCLCVLPFCSAFLFCLSVLPLCSAFVFCLSVLPLCSAFVFCLCVLPLCSAFVFCLCVLPLCSAFVFCGLSLMPWPLDCSRDRRAWS